MLYADAGIYMPESKTTLVYSRLVKRLRALNLASFRDYCDLVGSPDGSGERLRDAVGADHQRHPLLPRTAPFRASQRPCAAAAVGIGAPRRAGAAVVGGLLDRARALFDGADRAGARAQRGRARRADSRQRHRPARRRGRAARASTPPRRSPRRPPPCASAISPPSAATNGAACRRARNCAAWSSSARSISTAPGRCQASSTSSSAATSSSISTSRPSRRCGASSPASSSAAASLYIGHSERVTGPGGGALRQRRRHRLSAQGRSRRMNPVRVLVVDDFGHDARPDLGVARPTIPASR